MVIGWFPFTLEWDVSFDLKEAYIGFFFSNVKGLQFYQSM